MLEYIEKQRSADCRLSQQSLDTAEINSNVRFQYDSRGKLGHGRVKPVLHASTVQMFCPGAHDHIPEESGAPISSIATTGHHSCMESEVHRRSVVGDRLVEWTDRQKNGSFKKWSQAASLPHTPGMDSCEAAPVMLSCYQYVLSDV
jgi:hypothetical protein